MRAVLDDMNIVSGYGIGNAYADVFIESFS